MRSALLRRGHTGGGAAIIFFSIPSTISSSIHCVTTTTGCSLLQTWPHPPTFKLTRLVDSQSSNNSG
eukprot:2494268-Amphidinium_carterae.1